MTAALRVVALDDPVAVALMRRQTLELNILYADVHEVSPHAVPEGSFASPDGTFLLAELDGEAVGCGGLRPCRHGPPGTAEIKRMFTDPAVRGHGIGRLLLHALEGAAADLGYERIWLNTGTPQVAATRLYEAAGYVPIAPFGEFSADPRSLSFAKSLREALPNRRD